MKNQSFLRKRFLAGLLVILFLAGTAASIYSQTIKLGDVNGNGAVDIIDAMQIAQYSAGMSPTGFIAAAADVNCDSAINVNDALTVARYAAGAIVALPCQTTTPLVTPTATRTPTATPTPTPTITIIPTSGNVDTTKFGRLTGVNWFGMETANACFHGLWARDYKSVLKQIKDMGFNCIRVPWANASLNKTPNSIQVNEYGVDAYTGETGMNVDLDGLSSLAVLDKVIEEAGRLGLKIILDNHSRAADGYMNETLWYTTGYDEASWISDWVTMINRYKSASNVVAADLKNEPHGNMGTGMKPPATWGYTQEGYTNTDWKAAAQKCGQAIQAANPNILIIVEGVEDYRGNGYWWGGNLAGVKDAPITGINNLIYSAHEYGPEVFNQSWFQAADFPSNMQAIWDQKWWFVHTQKISHLFFGEFGIKEASAADPSSTAYKWLTTFMKLMGNNSSWTFWCMNPNSGDTGGILKDDWVSVNTAKYNIIKPYLAPQ